MSDQQGWTAPGASTPPGDASYTSGTPDPTSDASWGPPPSAPPSGPSYAPPSGPAHAQPAHAQPPAPASGPSYVAPTAPLPQATGPGQPPVAPPGWVPPQLAPKPGIVPLRPLTLGEIWGGVMTAVRGNPSATIGLALVTTAVVLVPLTVIGLLVTDRATEVGSELSSFAGGGVLPAGLIGGQLASGIPTLATYVTALLLPLFMAVVIGQGVQGRRIGLAETARAARGRILPALGVLVLIGLMAAALVAVLVVGVVSMWVSTGTGDGGAAVLVTFLALLVFVVGIVFFSVRWCFAVTVVVLEGAGPVTALRRSWALSRRRGFWRIFGIRLLTGIVTAIAGSVITAPAGILAGVFDTGSGGVNAAALVLAQALTVLVQSVLTTPFSSGVDSLLYVDQRIRYEGLDVALLQQSVQGQDATPR